MVYPVGEYGAVYQDGDLFTSDDENECGRDLSLIILSIFFGLVCAYLLSVNNRLKRQVTHYKKQSQDSAGKVAELRGSVDQLGRQLLQSELSKAESTDDHSDEVLELKLQLQDYKSSSQSLERQLSRSKSECSRLEKELETFQTTRKSLKESKKKEKQLAAKIASLEKVKSEHLLAEERSARKVEDLESKIEEHQQTHGLLQDKIEGLERLSNRVSEEQDYLKKRLKAAQKEIAELERTQESEGEAAKVLLVKLALLMNIPK